VGSPFQEESSFNYGAKTILPSLSSEDDGKDVDILKKENNCPYYFN
jgi:hypothetical protein